MRYMITVVVYIFRNFNQYISTKFYNKNNGEERRSGATGTGVSQKGPAVRKHEKRKKASEKASRKRARALQVRGQ